MQKVISLTGQWVGRFTYGPEFGAEMHGEKVQFRFFLVDNGKGEFSGKSVDVEGFETNMDTAEIKGFLDGLLISFTKEYPKYFILDENGNSVEDTSQKPRLNYTGEFNTALNSFVGDWELWANEELSHDSSIVDIYTGTWEMRKDEENIS